jgi:hypothetical protein
VQQARAHRVAVVAVHVCELLLLPVVYQVVEEVVDFAHHVRHSLVDLLLQKLVRRGVVLRKVEVVGQVLRVHHVCQLRHACRNAKHEQLVQQAAVESQHLSTTRRVATTVAERAWAVAGRCADGSVVVVVVVVVAVVVGVLQQKQTMVSQIVVDSLAANEPVKHTWRLTSRSNIHLESGNAIKHASHGPARRTWKALAHMRWNRSFRWFSVMTFISDA